MTCLAAVHDHVVAGGTCVSCGLPVQLTGPLGADGRRPRWLAPPFADPIASARCRVTSGRHVVEHARGACTCCSAVLEAIGDRKVGGLVWTT